ncbi:MULTISPECIES: PHP domain-containing protein [Clostridium]|jgi:predicted metal-dependent phosphoesterase TrpH|uniref:PHP domain-containing protein n=3 Tax=Clostridium TaxID=1485 RepID=A0A1S8PCR2_CLOBE|nr:MULTISPECIES: PHP domain-containing protein [Clostridium]AXB84001.1 PHP domain-containing protein [Clostridium butyricum]MBC2457851.1 PHP domain-containing protein [Clostridium beijerinckii]MBC2474797.1 PHP domain-containing protein [Clostridium beijerinckii]MDB2157032.1 PHP domain-containing protein [Clostridium butyricum]MDG5854987.1 PHP domain-containing protein [Clostridium beijerinckii]
MIYADLHVHTNHSDGICEIAQVIAMAKEKGIQALAITDHDTVDQFDEIKKCGNRLNIDVIKGVEMSCYDYEVLKKVHIIGLWLNEDTPHIKKLCDETLRCRDNCHRDLINELIQKGYKITYEDAKKYSKYSIVFKMNIFQALKEKYPHEMTKERYRELFASKTSKETDSKMGYISVMEGIKAIKQDGGIAIIAHPCEYNNYAEIEKYVEYGLQGIEINHSKMKMIDYQKTLDLATKHNLVKSGGSDFHDPNFIEFGQFGLTKQQYEELKHRSR